MVESLHELFFTICCKLHCLAVVLTLKIISTKSYEKKNKKEK